jgi:hypothetical protein
MNDMIAAMEADAAAAKEQYAGVSLTELGRQALDLENMIEEREQSTKVLKKELEKIMRFAIPEALAQIGIDEFGVSHDGGEARIKMETKVVGSLRNAPDENAAVAYLEASGLSGVVRSVIELDFAEEERELADQIMPQLEALTGKHPHLSRSINAQTLMAFVRQKLKEDPTFDYERCGITAYPQARFTKRR